jgi:hypothetical protein
MSPLDGQQDHDVVPSSLGEEAQRVYERSDVVEERHRLIGAGAHIAGRRQQPTFCRHANVHVARPVVVTTTLIRRYGKIRPVADLRSSSRSDLENERGQLIERVGKLQAHEN